MLAKFGDISTACKRSRAKILYGGALRGSSAISANLVADPSRTGDNLGCLQVFDTDNNAATSCHPNFEC
jgi:hypothetical protein